MSNAIPVLAYHKVGAPVHSSTDHFLNISPANFKKQMLAFYRMGYSTITFSELADYILQGRRLPSKTFVVTFDDGYRCVGEFAAPILSDFGFRATVFIVSSRVGEFNVWDIPLQRPLVPLMDWDEIRSLEKKGWEIGGHTHTHPHLDTLSQDDAFEEIMRGKIETEKNIQTSLTTFCYPAGRTNISTPDIVRKCGFNGACTVKTGLVNNHQNPYLLPRINVAYKDGITGLLYRMLLRPSLPNLRRNRAKNTIPLPVYNNTANDSN